MHQLIQCEILFPQGKTLLNFTVSLSLQKVKESSATGNLYHLYLTYQTKQVVQIYVLNIFQFITSLET